MIDTYHHWKTRRTHHPTLSVVIPVYNDQEALLPTIGAMAAFITEFGLPWELIIADDGSTDWTVPLAEDLPLVNVRVLKAERKRGKGSAVRRGMLAAEGDYILFADADNATPIEELPSLLDAMILEEYDIAVGSRREVKRGLCRLLNAALRACVRVGLNVRVKDTQCGFKLFKREVASALYTRQTLTGFTFDLELLYLAQKFGYSVAEIPVTWFQTPGPTRPATAEALRALRDIVRIRLNNARGLYRMEATS
jgi:dolichyl-phosphate beta-glucosyltransferase